jgi:hypothetical protein
VPLALKLAYTGWMAVWIPIYWVHNGPANFLWLCDTANLILLPALWLESALLVSSQAVGVLLVQLLWAIDFLGALATGSHLIGGTEYMFDPTSPLWLRSLSLFHLAMPPLLIWGVWRLGYDRRGFRLETVLVWGLVLASLGADPERNLNWVWEPFGRAQTLVPHGVYLAVLLAAYPLVVFLPTHLALKRWARRSAGPPRLLP